MISFFNWISARSNNPNQSNIKFLRNNNISENVRQTLSARLPNNLNHTYEPNRDSAKKDPALILHQFAVNRNLPEKFVLGAAVAYLGLSLAKNFYRAG